MRKGILVFILLLLSPLCFAQQKVLNDVEFFSGMPFFYGRGYNVEEEEVSFKNTFISENPSFSGGIGLVSYALSKDNSIGFFFTYENYYVKAFVYNLPSEELVFNQINITKAENYQFGVKIKLLEAGNFKFPFMFGINATIIKASANPSAGVTWDIERTVFGTLFSNAAELHFNESIFFFARLQINFTVFATTDMIKYTECTSWYYRYSYYVDKYKETEIGVYVTATPVIGLGLKLNGLFSK